MNIKDKITKRQLSMIIISFILGDFAIMNPAKVAKENAWIAFLLAWVGGFILISIYVYIAKLNPNKTLIEIVKYNFGKFFGTIVSILYIWYFLHLGSLVLRTSGEYMTTVNYPETPISFINIVFAILLAYGIKKGIKVIGRASEIFSPTLIILVTVMIILVSPKYKLNNLLPILNTDIVTLLKDSYPMITFPFGEAIVLMMIFPYIDDDSKLFKTVKVSVIYAGLILVGIILRDLLVLGPDMLQRNLFPPHNTAGLIPKIAIEPIISVNLLISGGGQIIICMFAAITGISQLLNLEDYRPFILPVTIFVVSLSIWIYEDISQLFQIAAEVYPYYAIPFQFIFPFLLLIISVIKNKKKINTIK